MSGGTSVLLHLTANEFGGVETHVYYLALALAKAGAQVTLTSHRRLKFNDDWARSLSRTGIRLVRPPLDSGHGLDALGLFLARARMLAAFHARPFDVVVGQGHGGAFKWMKRFVKPGGLFLWHEYWYGVPTNGDNYGAYEPPPLRRLPDHMLNLIYSVDAIVVGCDRATHNLRTIQGAKCPIHVIPPLTELRSSGDVSDKRYCDESLIKVAMIARQGIGKGTMAILDLWPELDIGNSELHLFGPVVSGPAGSRIFQRASELSSLGVHVHGPFDRATLPGTLGEIDLGLMLSIEEGFGLVPLEYMACGVPFVMTDVGAAPEFTCGNPDAEMVAVSLVDVKRGIESMVNRIRSGLTSRLRLHAHYKRSFSFEKSAAEHVNLILNYQLNHRREIRGNK